SRTARLGAVLAAGLGLASLAVVAGRSHDEEQAEPPAAAGGQDGPRRDQAGEMPTAAVGLEITLGIGAPGRTEWAGEVTVSEGKVLGLDVIRAAPGARVEAGKFALETTKQKQAAKKKKKQQQAKKKQAAGPAAVV